jgi:hypothetical protein
MKRCPRCGQTYSDEDINFCLNDGELLSRTFTGQYDPEAWRTVDDSPPTAVLPDTRTTNPTGWPVNAGPITQYQTQYQSPIFAPQMMVSSPDQVLAIVSLATGASSLALGWCCGLGLILAPAGIVTGIVAMIQNKNNPEKYGGRGLAIGGIATGSIFLVLYILYFILVVLLNLIQL